MNDLAGLSFITVLDPVADFQDFHIEPVKDYPKRPASLKGKRIEVLPNWKNGLKPFAAVLAKRFEKDAGVAKGTYRDTGWLYTHPDKVDAIGPDADKIAANTDLMVSTVGDCGGCTLWSVKACIEFEKRGIPTAVVVTDVFEHRAHQLLTSLGYPHIPVIVVDNPVIYLTEPEINKRIDGIMDKLVAALTTNK